MSRREVPDDWDERMRQLGLRLQRLRVQAGLTQEELAYRSGITRSHYQQLEKGASRPGVSANPSLLTISALAQTLGVEVGDLLSASDDTRPTGDRARSA